jgi:hypothetical protein
MMSLTANIEVPAGQTDTMVFRVILRITNHTNRIITMLNPDMGIPTPTMHWPFSNETYQTSLLISFGYLSMAVTDEAGQELPPRDIQTWATPVLRPKIELTPGDSFELAIPIGNFYQLASGRAYRLELEYGDQKLKALARTYLTLP